VNDIRYISNKETKVFANHVKELNKKIIGLGKVEFSFLVERNKASKVDMLNFTNTIKDVLDDINIRRENMYEYKVEALYPS
jgi:SLT domain-containing protein